MVRTRSVWAATATILVSGLLVGCGGDEPSADPTPIFSEATSSPSPSPTLSDREIQEALIARWVTLRDEMWRTGDGSKYREFAPLCQGCLDEAKRAEGIYTEGGYFRTSGNKLGAIVQVGSDSQSAAYRFTLEYAPIRFRESADSAPRLVPGGTELRSIQFVRPEGDWSILFVSRESE